MSRYWYEIETLTSRETIKSALAAANNNQSAAAAELRCTAEQLKKAMDAYAVPAVNEKGTELQLRLRRMLAGEDE